jgi:hypothetical protein
VLRDKTGKNYFRKANARRPVKIQMKAEPEESTPKIE